jgi:endonuclease YncB( thermonuclease family)
LIRLLAILLAAWSLPAAAERCRAMDGDTLQCGSERVRLYAVYAAEMNEYGGAEAKRNLQAFVRGREVELQRYGQDRYGRTLADLYVDGRKVLQEDIGPRAGRGTRSNYASRPR